MRLKNNILKLMYFVFISLASIGFIENNGFCGFFDLKKINPKINLNDGFFLIMQEETVGSIKIDGTEIIFQEATPPSIGSAFLFKNRIVTNYHITSGSGAAIIDSTYKIYHLSNPSCDEKMDVCFYNLPEKILNKLKKYKVEGKNKGLRAIGIFGEFNLFNDELDSIEDSLSKPGSHMANGKFCFPGVSGSAVINESGIVGYIWGAENQFSTYKRVHGLKSRLRGRTHEKYKSYKMPYCFFIIGSIEK